MGAAQGVRKMSLIDGFGFIDLGNSKRTEVPSRRKPKQVKVQCRFYFRKAALEIIRFFLISSTYLSRQKKINFTILHRLICTLNHGYNY